MSRSTREKIIASARKLLAQGSFSEMTMQRIADEVGVTKPALYHFFSSKDDIYMAVMEDLIEQVKEDTTKVNETTASESEKLLQMIRSRLEFGSQNKSILQFWDMAQRTISPEKLGRLCTSHQELQQMSKDILEQNKIRKPDMALMVLMSSILKYVQCDPHCPLPPQDDFAEYLHQLMLSQTSAS